MAPPFFNVVLNACVEPRHSQATETGVGRKIAAGKGRPQTPLSSCAPREPGFACILLRLASIQHAYSQHIARGRVTSLRLLSRDVRMRSASRCHLLRLSHFPDPGAPMMPGCCGDSLQLASMACLRIDRSRDAFVNADEGYPGHIRDSGPPFYCSNLPTRNKYVSGRFGLRHESRSTSTVFVVSRCYVSMSRSCISSSCLSPRRRSISRTQTSMASRREVRLPLPGQTMPVR